MLDDRNRCLCCLQSANLALSAIFMLELVIKHIALGLLGYWRQGFNVLDGIIVAASIAELGVTRKWAMSLAGLPPCPCDAGCSPLSLAATCAF